MKKEIKEKIEIPSGFSCKYENKVLHCTKGSAELSKKISAPGIEVSVEKDSVHFSCKRASRKERKVINSFIKHVANMFQGLNKKFVYKLEACNVHFPMTLKLDAAKLTVNNFLGEKTPRYAKVLPNVDVQIKGQIITISSFDKEAAGQTAANFEFATRIRARDRRVFQDGIYITDKPEREI